MAAGMSKTIRIACEGAATIALDDLQGFQADLKTLAEADAAKLRGNILKYGFSAPIFAWKNGKGVYILDGHQRVKILEDLRAEGYTIPALPVDWIKAGSKAEAKRKLLTIASQFGKVARQGLDAYLLEIGVPLIEALPEIRLPDLPGLRAPVDDTDDAAPAVDATEAIAKPGDVWSIGAHRVVCGDALGGAIGVALDGKAAHMIFTDPPYNVDYGSSKKPRHKIRSMTGDKQNARDWEAFNAKLAARLSQVCEGDVYMWGASSPDGMKARMAFVDAGLHWSATIIWKKQQLILTPAKYQRIYEPCLYGWFGKSSYAGDRKQTEVWEVDRPRRSDEHPTMKPVQLSDIAITNSSREGDVVLDCFLGSGSTLISCEKHNRVCAGVEIEPRYVDVTVKRYRDWCAANGRPAVIKRNGEAEPA